MTPRYRLSLLLLLTFASPASVAQNCDLGNAEVFLENAGVRALLFNNGALFWKGGDHIYEIPKGSGRQAMFAMGLWIGGMVDDTLHFAGSDYGPYEYWPGPLAEDGGAPSAASCAAYDRIWRVTLEDIARYNTTGEATPDLAEWPAEAGAPVVDGDGDLGNYDLAAGDRPAILGDETAWWIMNDRGDTHAWSRAPAIGLEVRVTAATLSDGYVADRTGLGEEMARLLHTATLYRYELTYRGTEPFEDMYLGLWADPDLGDAGDDYVGSYPPNNVGFVYNGDDFDAGSAGYGASPPALGLAMAAGPASPLLSGFVYYNGDGGVQGNPASGGEAYLYLRSLWRDGSPLTYGGTGYQTGAPTRYMFPDLPPNYWSEMDIDGTGRANIPADRRFIVNHGPFSVQPGETTEIRFALVFSREETGRIASVRKLALFDAPRVAAIARVLAPDPGLATITLDDLPSPLPPDVEPPDLPERYRVAESVWPNPTTRDAVLRVDLPGPAYVRLTVYDALGRRVSIPVDETLPAAEHRLGVPTSGLPPGLYVYRLEVTPEGLSPLVSVGRFSLVR